MDSTWLLALPALLGLIAHAGLAAPRLVQAMPRRYRMALWVLRNATNPPRERARIAWATLRCGGSVISGADFGPGRILLPARPGLLLTNCTFTSTTSIGVK